MKNEKARILVVDDDTFMREILSFVLDAGGYPVETTDSGAGALKLLTAGEGFDLIITDINMPEMDGIELTRSVKALEPSLPVILLSGGGDMLPEHPADDCVVKDENLQEAILDVIERVIRKGRG